MVCHAKNNVYVQRWREKNRNRYREQNAKDVLKHYYYYKQIKELMKIDPTLFS